MKWKRARFKDGDVWVGLDESGAPLVEGGRVPIRYSKRSGAKVYRAAVGRVQPHVDAAIEQLDEGAPADAAPRQKKGRGSGFGKAGTRTAGQAAAARQHARQLLEDLPDGTIVVYTDGACQGNPGPAGSGVVVELPEGRRLEGCRSLGQGTNNVAELSAVELALDVLDQEGVQPDQAVAVLSDSDYTHGVLCKGWKAKANQELIRSLRARLSERPGVTIHWVAGHVGLPGNERADALANEGVRGQTRVDEGAP